MDDVQNKTFGKAEAINRINDIATDLKQATFGLMLRTSDGVISEGYANLENAIGVFLAKLILEGKKFGFSESNIAEVAKKHLNAIPATTLATPVSFSADTVVTPSKRAAAEGFIERWAALGVDTPNVTTSPSIGDNAITFIWRAQRSPERRSYFTIELEIWNDRYTLRTQMPGRNFTSGIDSTSFDVSELYEREFFEKQGLCAKVLHASEFNPLRGFNI